MSEGTSRAEAATHILARETGRRMRAVQARIDEVEEQRKIALDAISSRLTEHDGFEARQDGLIDGLRADLETVQAVTSAIDAAHGETRELTAGQAQELVRIAQRLTANEAVDARQDGTLSDVLDRVDVLEATAPVPGPKGDRGEKGDRGPAGPRGAMGPPGISGSGGSGSGGSGAINSVIASSGLSVTGTSDLTITNIGVRSLTVSGLTVSASTGDVTLTAPTISGGTGVTVSGTGTTSITVSATGVNSVTAGTGINVSGTTALTVSATGVQSLTAGNGITVSGTTTPTVSASLAAGTGIGISGTTTLSVSNTGVTSLAGTGVTVSASTGAVTITAPVVAGGTGISVAGSQTTSLSISNSGVTSIVAGTNVSVSGATGAVTVNAPAFATPGSSAVGDSAAAGTATTVARSDHTHGREAFATPGASAVADTASAGSATTVARSDHRHSREAFGTPGAVTGGATAASGSATTLARSDHVHSTASLPVLLASTTLGSTTASVTFSSIAGTYKHLNIVVSCRSTSTFAGGYDVIVARFNGDTGSNYYSTYDNTVAYTYLAIATIHNSQNFIYSNALGMAECNVGRYTAAYYKVGRSLWGNPNSNTTNSLYQSVYAYMWKSTAAITQVDVFLQTGSFAAGSQIDLYGLP